MATAAYRQWNSAGRHWAPAIPIEMLEGYARAAGIPVIGVIGNQEHLTNDRPEDHTPFSVTAWPLPLPGWIVTAIDLKDGPYSDTILADARRGALPWLKYMNFRGHHYNVKRGWKQETSSDGHLHISIRTDHLSTTIGNPFVPQSQKGHEMLKLAKIKGNDAVIVGNGIFHRAVITYPEMLGIQDMIRRNGGDAEVKEYTTWDEAMAVVGRINADTLRAVPAGDMPSAEDIARALVAMLRP